MRSITGSVFTAVFTVFVSMCVLAPPASAQNGGSAARLGGLAIDETSTKAIVDATTEKRFLTPLVSAIPDHPTIPSPRDYLGYIAGAPGEMTNVKEIHGYMRAIASATDRAKVVSLGNTEEGREMIALIIADRDTLAGIDDYFGKLDAISDPRKTDASAAEAIISTAKPVNWITTGMHSTEFGPPETAMEIAYRVAAEERDIFKRIRSHVITIITPVFEVDGRNRSVEWFRRHHKGRTNYYDRPPTSPPFWGHYTFHDNNRDGIGLSQPLTKNFLRGVLRFKPTLSLDLHESVPYLYVATGTGPYNESVSPITVSEWASIANYEVSRLTGMGLPGVWTWGFYTGWYPGYMLWMTNVRNSNGRFYETFGNGSSETMRRDLGDSRYAGDKVIERTWYRPSPPSEDTLWSMRNNVNFMSSGVYVSLDYAARNGKELVRNFYRKGVNAVAKGKEKAPYAFVIKHKQRDPGAARELIDLVIEQGIEVRRVKADAKIGKLELKEGDGIVRLDQPYGPFAKNLFEKQKFPEKAKVPPYDDVAWTLGLLRGVDVKPVGEKKVFEVSTDPAASGAAFYNRGALPANAKFFAVRHKAQEGLGELRFALASAKMLAAAKEVKVGDETFPAGTIFIDATTVDKDALDAVADRTLLEFEGVGALPESDLIELDVPRIGLIHSWISTQDPGWVRFTLDRSKIPYKLIEKTELRAGNLREKYDVIVAPNFGGRGSLKALISGVNKKWSPLAYTNTPKTPSHGHIAGSPDITGGFGFEGLIAIKEFLNAGGTFIGMGSGGSLAVDSGIVRNISMSRPRINTPGSIITMKITNPGSPLTFGYDEMTYAFRGNTSLYRVGKDYRDLAVAQFGTKKASVRPWNRKKGEKKKKEKPTPLVLSGAVLSGKGVLNGAPAVLRTRVGKGRVVLFGWNPMHRYLNHHDHAFVYNALIFWNDLK